MAVYDTGKLIKQLREQKGITQDELADGIIDRAGLSRIENGIQMPHMSTLNALFQRLGFDSQSINYYADNNGFATNNKRKELDSLLVLLKKAEAKELIRELENDPGFQKPLERQYIMSAKAALAINNEEENLEETYRQIIEAIKISIPFFHEKYIGDYHISLQEYVLINMLHIYYYNKGDNEKAVDILLKVKESFDNCSFDVLEKAKLYPNLVYNLTKSLFDMKRYKEAADICDDGIDVCIKSDKVLFLPLIVMHKAYCLLEMGEVKEGKKFIFQAYYGCDMIGRTGTAIKIQKYVKEKYNIILEDL